MYPLSLIIGAVVGVNLMNWLMPFLQSLVYNDYSPGMQFLVITLVSVLIVTLFFVLHVLSIMGVTWFVRGKQAIGYSFPRECISTKAWLCDSWYYSSSSGRQSGLRYFGIEIALKGQLI